MTITGLVKRVTASDMWDRQQKSNDYRDKYTYGAIKALHEYYEELADDIGEPIEFDYIGIACEWAEYTARELEQDYAHLGESGVWTGTTDELLEELRESHTILVVETLDTDSIAGWSDNGFKYHTTYLVQE